MAIGFMSFGGMLTGGDDAAKQEEKTVKVDSKVEKEDKVLANNIKDNE
jgi:Na+-transporting NADH:ubiquinone oxidoreductase subunit E